jgi:hypothetical protein
MLLILALFLAMMTSSAIHAQDPAGNGWKGTNKSKKSKSSYTPSAAPSISCAPSLSPAPPFTSSLSHMPSLSSISSGAPSMSHPALLSAPSLGNYEDNSYQDEDSVGNNNIEELDEMETAISKF